MKQALDLEYDESPSNFAFKSNLRRFNQELAKGSGVQQWGRVPALDTNPVFINDLADAVIEAGAYSRPLLSSS